MNKVQWQRVAAPIVADLVSVVHEFALDPKLEDFDGPLRRRYRAAGQRRDAEAVRRVCAAMKREALRRMLASEVRRAS
jgi:hypothetical protein